MSKVKLFTLKEELQICDFYSRYGMQNTIERFNIKWGRTLYNIIERNNTELKGYNRIGKNNPHWKGGDIRDKILKRDNYRCKICGNKNNIDIHHIYPKIQFPSLIKFEKNIITLCRTHHMRFEGNEYIGLYETLNFGLKKYWRLRNEKNIFSFED